MQKLVGSSPLIRFLSLSLSLSLSSPRTSARALPISKLERFIFVQRR